MPQTQPTDSAEELALVRRAAAGDDGAFEEIVRRTEKLVYSVALRSAPCPEDAADIAQESYVKTWRALSSFRGECALSTWVCRITLNCCCDHARSAAQQPYLSLSVPDEDGEDERTVDIPDPDPAGMPEEAVLRQEEIEAVRAALDALPADMRTILTLRDIVGFSYTEIADVLSLEMGTVKSRINRARAALKNILTERNFSPDFSSNGQNTENGAIQTEGQYTRE